MNCKKYKECIWNEEFICKCEYALIVRFNDDRTQILECSGYENSKSINPANHLQQKLEGRGIHEYEILEKEHF